MGAEVVIHSRRCKLHVECCLDRAEMHPGAAPGSHRPRQIIIQAQAINVLRSYCLYEDLGPDCGETTICAAAE
jgi:hypothetical protein